MRRVHDRRAFTLVEVTLAMGIASFCLIAVFGLLPAGLSSNRDSNRQTMAANVATDIVADLRATPTTSSSTPFYGIGLTGATNPLFLNQDGSSSANSNATIGTVYRVSVTVTPPPATARTASTAWIRITWAAVSDPTKTTPEGAYETVVSLNRN